MEFWKDHLRVCGADLCDLVHSAIGQGSPPRVRSRQHVLAQQSAHVGITSACAEQTRERPA